MNLPDAADIVVVGAGNAALTAALSASESNAQVLILEKASRSDRGGNTAISSGMMRHSHGGKADIIKLVDETPQCGWDGISIPPYFAGRFYDDIMSSSKGRADPVLARVLSEKSYETVRWMKEELGTKFVLNDALATVINGVLKFEGPEALKIKGGGIHMSNGLFEKCEVRHNVSIMYGCAVQGLLVESGKVNGVSISRNGRKEKIRAGSVILGSGGFESSKELRERFLGSRWGMAKVRGTSNNTGETMLAAIDAGAMMYGDMAGCHATQIDARAPNYGNSGLGDSTQRYSWPYCILVNKDGMRFADEGKDFINVSYAKLARDILMQRDAVAYQLFDGKTSGLLRDEYGSVTGITVQALDEFNGKIDVDTCQLMKTVKSFNKGAGRLGKFNSEIRDGCRTEGVEPPKSNWAQAIDTSPFTAYPVSCGITYTYGGLRIDDKAHVLRKDGTWVEGLYATGEITGGFFYGDAYPRGTGLMRGAVFGRIAGAEASASFK